MSSNIESVKSMSLPGCLSTVELRDRDLPLPVDSGDRGVNGEDQGSRVAGAGANVQVHFVEGR